MLPAKAKGFDGPPTSTFNFVLKSPVTPSRTTLSPTPTSPDNKTHRRVRSRGRSLDRRTRNTDRLLSHSCSPPTTKTSQHESSPGLGHGREDFKAQDVNMAVESSVFHSKMITEIMKVIDDCKALEIGQNIELPRLVLAGERSSGKSSLLENLTGLPVPIATGQGTRFPIEFKMIKDINKFDIKPRIIPSGLFTNLDPKKLQEFNEKRELTRPRMKIEFMELLREVSVILDVPPPIFASDPQQSGDLVRNSTISRHCLQIEIRGPNFVPLSIIDTPGLYHTSDDLREIGIAMEIQNLVEGLAKDKRNIIIGVMEAPQQRTGASIFQIAKRFDPFGERTLGVLTKCDCVSDGESEAFQAVLKTAQNTQLPLKHGWYVIKNRPSSEAARNISLEEARRKELALFSGIPWHPVTSRLEEGRMGIDALRKGLSDIYVHQVQADFSSLVQKIRYQLAFKKAELQALDENAFKLQRKYLKSIVKEYKSRADEYSREESIEGVNNDTEHLAVQLEARIQTLSEALNLKGAARAFHFATDQGDLVSAIAAVSRCAGDLADESNIYTWINERYQTTTGYRIPGCIPQSFITELFNEQMGPWESIIESFITAVSQSFQKAILGCFQLVHDSDKVLQHRREELLMKALEVKIDELRQECLVRSKYHLSQLFQLELEKRVFNREVQEAQLKRLKTVVAWMADPSGLTNTEKLGEYLNSDQHIVFQVHDILKSLHNLAVRDYTSWIKMSFLGPDFIKETMDVCNDQLFDALSDEEIDGLFKPDPEAEKARKALEDVIEKRETLLKDLEAIMEKPFTFSLGKKPADAGANHSSDMLIRTKPGQGLVK